jgi:hypothetical protein
MSPRPQKSRLNVASNPRRTALDAGTRVSPHLFAGQPAPRLEAGYFIRNARNGLSDLMAGSAAPPSFANVVSFLQRLPT